MTAVYQSDQDTVRVSPDDLRKLHDLMTRVNHRRPSRELNTALSLLARHLPERSQPQRPAARLAPREQRLLKLEIQDLATETIAAEMHISLDTLYVYRSEIMRKLNVQSMCEVRQWAKQKQHS